MPKTPIDALADEYAASLADLNPIAASEIGLAGYADQMPDYSADGAAALDELQANVLSKLDDLAVENSQDHVTRDALTERLTVNRQLHATGVVELNNIASPVQDIRAVFDLMPTATPEDWHNIAVRLSKVQTALVGYRGRLAAAAKTGIVPARRQVDACIGQSKAAAGGFFADLIAQASGIPASLQADLQHSATVASHAYQEFATYLADDLYGQAREEDAVGQEYYQLASREFLGATVDLAETYHWGLEELERITREQQRVADGIRPSSSIPEARQLLSADPARQLHGTEALRRWMQALSDRTVNNMKRHFHIPAPMDSVEAMIAPTQDGGIYYTGPSEDFSRPGRMWWSVPEEVTEFTTWREKTTVYHEGVPGHHLQTGQAAYQSSSLNTWRRMACWVSGHGEGWALYAERLMQDLGFLGDDGDLMGMLDSQRLRAARVVVDIGVHLGKPCPQRWGGGTWDAQKAWDFLNAHVSMEPEFLQFELNRYLGWPGQAPSYKVGQRLWEQLRDRARERAGTDFDLAEFHRRALSVGSVGLDTLSAALDR